jgi:GMP synthase (glutamine-hydrolysing)
VLKERNIALLQVRDSDKARLHEQECFAEACGLEGNRLEYLDLIHGPLLEWSRLEGFDAVLIGGAGAHSAVDDHPFTAPLARTMERWIEEGRPVFGSCWGHHFLAKILGGDLVHDRSTGEVGSFDITLTTSGQEDALFGKVPKVFVAQLGHHDRVARLPPGAVELAYSERCRNQAFKLEGVPVYGTQFHSELDAKHLLYRLNMYSAAYLDQTTVAEEVAQSLQPSPYVRPLLRRFLELFA